MELFTTVVKELKLLTLVAKNLLFCVGGRDLALFKHSTALRKLHPIFQLCCKISFSTSHSQSTSFFIRKLFFCLSLNFLNITPEIRLIFLISFLNFYLLLFLILNLISVNTYHKRHFLNNAETKEC